MDMDLFDTIRFNWWIRPWEIGFLTLVMLNDVLHYQKTIED